jgi:hypothetical protein
MKTQHFATFTVAFAIASAASLAAQSGSQADRATSKPITVTGCLERDTPTSASTSSATTTAGTTGAERFLLIKGEPGPSGSDTFNADAPNGPWYLVVGNAGELRHGAKRVVEVKGTLDAMDKGGEVVSGKNPPAGTLHATTIKVLSGSCGE